MLEIKYACSLGKNVLYMKYGRLTFIRIVRASVFVLSNRIGQFLFLIDLESYEPCGTCGSSGL